MQQVVGQLLDPVCSMGRPLCWEVTATSDPSERLSTAKQLSSSGNHGATGTRCPRLLGATFV